MEIISLLLQQTARLIQLAQQVEVASDLIRKFAAATASVKVWKEHYPLLDKEALTYLASEFSSIEVATPHLEYNPTMVSRSLKHLDVRFHEQ